MYFFVTAQNLPVGYLPPPFPSLFWPAGAFTPKFESAYLYYSSDVWNFTVCWSLIFFGTVYFIAGVWSAIIMFIQSYRQVQVGARKHTLGWRPFVIIPTYVVIGGIHGLLSGAIIGLILLLIYKAGSLAMSTWIPFCWGMASILYHICASYSTSLTIM